MQASGMWKKLSALKNTYIYFPKQEDYYSRLNSQRLEADGSVVKSYMIN